MDPRDRDIRGVHRRDFQSQMHATNVGRSARPRGLQCAVLVFAVMLTTDHSWPLVCLGAGLIIWIGGSARKMPNWIEPFALCVTAIGNGGAFAHALATEDAQVLTLCAVTLWVALLPSQTGKNAMGAVWTVLCFSPALAVSLLSDSTNSLAIATALVLLGGAGLLVLRHLSQAAREAGGWQFDQEELEAVIIHLQTTDDG
ncbi:MAG: hypothetical protein HOI95_09815 [Chromatiales bacterium]|jgi:hypothetical protein|nr:hypothetical protein [Chromatiales bacterium]